MLGCITYNGTSVVVRTAVRNINTDERSNIRMGQGHITTRIDDAGSPLVLFPFTIRTPIIGPGNGRLGSRELGHWVYLYLILREEQSHDPSEVP